MQIPKTYILKCKCCGIKKENGVYNEDGDYVLGNGIIYFIEKVHIEYCNECQMDTIQEVIAFGSDKDTVKKVVLPEIDKKDLLKFKEGYER